MAIPNYDDGDKKTPRSVDELNFTEIGNNIMTPLLAGLVHSSTAGKGGFATTMKLPINTEVPLGSPLRLTQTFPNGRVMRARMPRNEDDDFLFHEEGPQVLPTISAFTDGIDKVHRQLLDVGYYLGMLVQPQSLPDNMGEYIARYVHENKDKAISSLNAENMPTIDLRFKVDGQDRIITIKNEPVGVLKKPLVHVLVALGLAGDSVAAQTRPIHEFMFDATGGFVHTLPPLMTDVYRKLKVQLDAQGLDGAKVLADSKCDVDRGKLREAFNQLLTFADVYETAAELRGSKDVLATAFKQIRKAMGGTQIQSSIEARDAYEYTVLIEGMVDYAIAHNPKQEKERLVALKAAFVDEVQHLLPNDITGIHNHKDPQNFTPSNEMIVALPQVAPIMEAFQAAYAGQFLLDKDMGAADRAWTARVTRPPTGEIIR